MLLWLSHLARTPFDLASISSLDSETDPGITLPFEPPVGLPTLASRLLALGFRYLQSATKEQEAATMLLVRLCTRPDMNHLGLHERCIRWSLQSLANPGGGSMHVSIYSPIGTLSFLAGFFKYCNGTAVAPFLVPVLDYMQDIIAGRPNCAKTINGSAAVRKLMIKIHRTFAVHLLSGNSLAAGSLADESDLLGTVVDHLLITLGDKDSRVRFAASKALSIIAQRLDQDMTAQLVDDITKRLQADVVLKSIESDAKVLPPLVLNPASLEQDRSAVNPLQWQGLILTLSHLLFRHSTPQHRLTSVVGHIMDGLDFEQRSSMGMSIGSGVRDAACFGMWSLARKYTTRELLRVAASSIRSRRSPRKHTSVFGALAAELVVTATLDPEGNIRRGASAALQELVGRHPDIIPNGIALIQIVDYQAVGLRSRAMCNVALHAASLDDLYLYAISDGLLSWRAINSPEANIRRFAAFAIGQIFRLYGSKSMSPLQQRFKSSKTRSLDEWHGLYQAFAAAIHNDPSFIGHGATILRAADSTEDGIYLLREDASLSGADITATGKNADLAAEALCIMICVLGQQSKGETDAQLLDYHRILIELSLQHYSTSQRKVAYRDAPVVLFNQLNEQGQKNFLHDWLMKIKEAQRTQHNPEINMSWIAVLGSILSEGSVRSIAVVRESLGPVRDVLLSQLRKESDWQAKIAALRYLYISVYHDSLRHNLDTQPLHQALVDCLSDYSILASRDVGSEVRMQAIETVGSMDDLMLRAHAQRIEIFGKIYGLAVEKLDKVRDITWKCIENFSTLGLKSNDRAKMSTVRPKQMVSFSTSSTTYFEHMISLCKQTPLQSPIIEGLITSASTGSEGLIHASRMAITKSFATFSSREVDLFYESLLHIIRADIPDGRLVRPGLEVLAFLLDVDTIPRLTETISEWQDFLETMAILCKSSEIRVLDAIVKIYAGLTRYDSLRTLVLPVLRLLLVHRYPKVRLVAATALFVTQPNDQLKALDLSSSAKSVRERIAELRL